MPKITKRLVDTLHSDPEGKDLFVWDNLLKGFGLRLKATGAGAYVVQYRNAQGQSRRLTVGRLGILTPEEARSLARDKLASATKGADPVAEKRAARKATTVAEVCTWYLDQAESGALLGRRGAKIKPYTLYQDRSRIETHVLPLLGKRAVASLTLADIEKFQADIARGKTSRARKGRGAVVTGGPGAASRCVGMLRTIFSHAERRKVIKSNPAAGVKRLADGKKDRFLSPEEIAALGKALRAAEAEGMSRTGLAAIRALLLTGCRRNEILGLPLAWLDAEAHCLRLADSKSGPQTRPIGTVAVEFLASRRGDGEWLFPADRGEGHFIGLRHVLARVCKQAKLDGVTPHVLRHTYASTAAAMGFSELVIAGLLGHAAAGVTNRYSHLADPVLIAAADRVSARIAALLDGTEDTAKVVPLRA